MIQREDGFWRKMKTAVSSDALMIPACLVFTCDRDERRTGKEGNFFQGVSGGGGASPQFPLNVHFSV